ncbi:MAG: response regulator transcription factor [Bdellovibrionota bacterium]
MRILVVEDQRKMLSFICKGLQEAGHIADGAESAASGELLSSENEYDLVILDVMLPDRTGLDLSRSLRQAGFAGPILMLTALGTTKDKVRGLDAGADDYLTKPFEFDELLARVRALLRRSGSHAAGAGGATTKLVCGDLEMDLLSRKVKRGSREIVLTLKEFSLLEYLLRNQGRPVSRTSILEHVWDIHHDNSSNVVDVCVNTIRKKIDAGFDKKLIETVIGVGYAVRES